MSPALPVQIEAQVRPWFDPKRAVAAAASAAVLGLAIAMHLNLVPGPGTFHAITVNGGSMGNALPAGSLALTRTVEPEQVRVGDVVAIARRAGGAIVLHRVVDVRQDLQGIVVTTRGDANASEDPEPTLLQGRGDRVWFAIPWAGYVYAYIRSPEGLLLVAMLVVLVPLGASGTTRIKQRRRANMVWSPAIAPDTIPLLDSRMRGQRDAAGRQAATGQHQDRS